MKQILRKILLNFGSGLGYVFPKGETVGELDPSGKVGDRIAIVDQFKIEKWRKISKPVALVRIEKMRFEMQGLGQIRIVMKSISVKSAERWLEKLRQEQTGSYRELAKILKRYERCEDQFECFTKMSHILLGSPMLARDLNLYMEEGNKFVINKKEEEKITELMGYIRKSRTDTFQRISTMIHEMSNKSKESNSGPLSPEEINKNLIHYLHEIIKGDKQLEEFVEKALQSGEQQILGLSLDHLKLNRPKTIEEPEDAPPRKQPKPALPKARPPAELERPKQIKLPKPQPFPPNVTLNDQKKLLKQFEKSMLESQFLRIIKLLHLFHLCIITKAEFLELIDGSVENEEDLECLRDIIQSRENDRRKTGAFRPLNDTDFSGAERPSPSYVTIPTSYPIRCKNRTPELKALLNDRWISVPHGSQQTFNVRNKNQFQSNLLRSEDQRYEFDLCNNRISKTIQMFDKVISALKEDPERDVKRQIRNIVEMGVIQIVYKNAHRDQKDELEWHMKTNTLEMCMLMRDRVNSQRDEMKIIKDIHGLKAWSEVAAKNFIKSLDLKCFEFKKGERERMKASVFISELNDRLKNLETQQDPKQYTIQFEEKKPLFSVLNSFESSSRIEKCTKRQFPEVRSYDPKFYINRSLLPLVILAFEDKLAAQRTYSLILFYIDFTIQSELQRSRMRSFLETVLVYYLGWAAPTKRTLSVAYEEEKFYAVLQGNPVSSETLESWICSQEEPLSLPQQEHNDVIQLGYREDKESQFSYLPPKGSKNRIILGSEHFYVFLRFLYALYERVIKMSEIAENEYDYTLFQILFFSCIKVKESMKFEENLNSIFRKSAYLFSTIYKLVESLVKSLGQASNCSLTAEGIKQTKINCEDIYLLLMSRFSLESNFANLRLLRFNYDTESKVLYINSLMSYAKTEDTRDHLLRRNTLSKSIQSYTIEPSLSSTKSKRKCNEIYEENGVQYLFDVNTFRMLTHGEKEDLLFYLSKKPPSTSKYLKRDLKRAQKFALRF